jgi:hypothetical protein
LNRHLTIWSGGTPDHRYADGPVARAITTLGLARFDKRPVDGNQTDLSLLTRGMPDDRRSRRMRQREGPGW